MRTTNAKNMVMLGLALLAGILWQCSPVQSDEAAATAVSPMQFQQYWYQGQAELTRYDLQQSRYGEIHQGDAVLVFVTEDFWSDKQVKYEFGDKTAVVWPILKLNFTRNFLTGIYPYSLITSVFTPVDLKQGPTLKVTSSAQEWCGQTFTQLNYRNNEYHALLRSYFQGEGDRDFALQAVLLEDEVWTKIRLAPESLPTGEIEVIPGLQYRRFAHTELKVEKAVASRAVLDEAGSNGHRLVTYKLEYKSVPRSLEIKYEADFPYRIAAWEERHKPSFGRKEWAITRAVKTHSLMLDYWTKHGVADTTYRRQLGLR